MDLSRSRILQILSGPGMFRLFLASMVVVQHFGTLHLGLWAVYTFFILSGFWISIMYRKKYSRAKHPMLTFWCSRYLRLLPVYLVCVALALVILRFSSTHWQDRDLLHDPQWLIREFLIVSSSSQPLLIWAAWSLDIEMQFYLVAPLLLPVIGRARPWQVLVVTIAAGLVSLAFVRSTSLPRYLMFFLIGALVDRSQWSPSGRTALASMAAFAGIVCAIIWMPAWHSLLIFPAGVPTEATHRLSVFLALVSVPLAAYTLRQPSSAMDLHFGNLAYSVYLFHPSVDKVGTYFAGFHTHTRDLIAHWIWLLVLPGSIVIYLAVDRPAEMLRKRFVQAQMRKGTHTPQLAVAETVAT